MNRLEFLQQLLLLPLAKFFRFSKPKGKAIYSSFIAGFQYYDGNKILKKLSPNDVLTLRRQPKNKYDEKAIEVYWNSYKLGYIPMAHNVVLANMLDSGIALPVSITSVHRRNPDWEKVEVTIFLPDERA